MQAKHTIRKLAKHIRRSNKEDEDTLTEYRNKKTETKRHLLQNNLTADTTLCIHTTAYRYLQDRNWRKTRSPNAGSNCNGTDPNRNWDIHWNGNDIFPLIIRI